MKRTHSFFLLILTSIFVSGCTEHKIHLTGSETARTGDIQIDGNSGIATWTWGANHYSQAFEVTDNKIMNAVVESGGALTLKLTDGTYLRFASKDGVWSCFGCESEHMPLLWTPSQQ